LQDHDVASAAITLYLQPVFGVLISIVVTGERPSVLFYAGGAMILLALFLGQHRGQPSISSAAAADPPSAP